MAELRILTADALARMVKIEHFWFPISWLFHYHKNDLVVDLPLSSVNASCPLRAFKLPLAPHRPGPSQGRTLQGRREVLACGRNGVRFFFDNRVVEAPAQADSPTKESESSRDDLVSGSSRGVGGTCWLVPAPEVGKRGFYRVPILCPLDWNRMLTEFSQLNVAAARHSVEHKTEYI